MRLRLINQPALWLCFLLQRTPALRQAFTASEFPLARAVSLLPSAAALGAALGSVHTLAGATQFVTTTENVVGTVGTRIVPVAFTLVGAPTPPLSFLIVGGSLPPGLIIEGEKGGVINTSSLGLTPVVVITGTPTKAGAYSISFDAYAEFNATSSTYGSLTVTFAISELARPVITRQPAGPVAAGGTVTLAVAAASIPGPAYQWTRNGEAIPNGTGPIFTLANFDPAAAGLYSAVATNAATTTTSDATIVGATTTNKVIGAGMEMQADIPHANGNVFDQVLLTGAAEAVTSDFALRQVTRTSFIDLTDDIVQVEFSGPGTLSLVLAGATGPGLPANYNQDVRYMKGHAGIVITGATRDTHVSVFSVGRLTAVNAALFRDATAYDGIADIAFIAIASTDGEFGAVRAANVNFHASKGLTGLYAPGVVFNGPVYIGDISAVDAAAPVLVLGSAGGETLITGGDLFQANAREVTAGGLTRLRFAAGSDSHGRALTAKANRAVLLQAGRDVTGELVVNPPP